MCLTFEAEHERKWRSLPALRKVLEDKNVPDRFFGYTSLSNNMFEATDRLMRITVFINEYRNEIKAAASVDWEGTYNDISHLEYRLENATRFFKENIDRVRELYAEP